MNFNNIKTIKSKLMNYHFNNLQNTKVINDFLSNNSFNSIDYINFVINAETILIQDHLKDYDKLEQTEIYNACSDLVYKNLNLLASSNIINIVDAIKLQSNYIKKSDLNLDNKFFDTYNLNIIFNALEKEYNKTHAKKINIPKIKEKSNQGSANFPIASATNLRNAYNKKVNGVPEIFNYKYENTTKSNCGNTDPNYTFTIHTNVNFDNYINYKCIVNAVNNTLNTNYDQKECLILFDLAKCIAYSNNRRGSFLSESELYIYHPFLRENNIKLDKNDAKKILSKIPKDYVKKEFYKLIKKFKKHIFKVFKKSFKIKTKELEKITLIVPHVSPVTKELHLHVCLSLFKNHNELEDALLNENNKFYLKLKNCLNKLDNRLNLDYIGRIYNPDGFIKFYLNQFINVINRCERKIHKQDLSSLDKNIYDLFTDENLRDIHKAMNSKEFQEYSKIHNNILSEILAYYPPNFFASNWRIAEYSKSKRFNRIENSIHKEVEKYKKEIAIKQDISKVQNKITGISVINSSDFNSELFSKKYNYDFKEKTIITNYIDKCGISSTAETTYTCYNNTDKNFVNNLIRNDNVILTNLHVFTKKVKLFDTSKLIEESGLSEFNISNYKLLNACINKAVEINEYFNLGLYDILDENDFDINLNFDIKIAIQKLVDKGNTLLQKIEDTLKDKDEDEIWNVFGFEYLNISDFNKILSLI